MQNTIIVVDDDPVNLLTAKKFLQQEYKVIAMNSGKTLLRYLENNEPDLILLDIVMPQPDGFELMRILQAKPEWSSIPVIFLTADRSSATEEKCFQAGGMDYVTKPFVGTVLSSRIRHALEISASRKFLENRLIELQSGIITAIANIIEGRDGTTGEHILRTKEYALYVMQKMRKFELYTKELTPRFISLLQEAAPMHDIGKLYIPDYVLQKPGIYTDEERAIMQRHAATGGELIRANMAELEEKDFVDIAYNVANFHHERWNGKGYPTGRAEQAIPLAARIMAIADVYDAITSRRSYKDSYGFKRAVEIMREGRGTDFEPCLIDAFLSDLDELFQLTCRLQGTAYAKL